MKNREQSDGNPQIALGMIVGNHYITFKFKPNTAEKKREIARERESDRARER